MNVKKGDEDADNKDKKGDEDREDQDKKEDEDSNKNKDKKEDEDKTKNKDMKGDEDKIKVKDIKEDFDHTLAVCREVTKEYETGRSAVLRLGQCILRLFAPLL